MQKDILLAVLEQSRMDCSRIVKKITADNADFRLTAQTASAGFIYRHIGEATNLLSQFFGYETDVKGTTMRQMDEGKLYDLDASRQLFEQGYATLEKVINETSDENWLEEVETLWFGNIPRIKLFSLTLFHNSHHCGQISSALVKGKKH